jgi:hypothetical protein
MPLRGQLLAVNALNAAQRDAMFALMDAYYVNLHRPQFERDLDEKRWVIWIEDEATHELRGFSTQMLLEADVHGKPITALFSGDTIIAKEAWREQALTHVWGRLALALMDRYPPGSLFWHLISKGYKTYRFLPVFFHEFYPRPEVATPPDMRELLDALGRQKFPSLYDPVRGVIRAGAEKDRLKTGVADVTAERLKDPFVQFFLVRNPRHHEGEELCCLAPLSRENFTAAAYRVIGLPPTPWEPLP